MNGGPKINVGKRPIFKLNDKPGLSLQSGLKSMLRLILFTFTLLLICDNSLGQSGFTYFPKAIKSNCDELLIYEVAVLQDNIFVLLVPNLDAMSGSYYYVFRSTLTFTFDKSKKENTLIKVRITLRFKNRGFIPTHINLENSGSKAQCEWRSIPLVNHEESSETIKSFDNILQLIDMQSINEVVGHYKSVQDASREIVILKDGDAYTLWAINPEWINTKLFTTNVGKLTPTSVKDVF